MSQSTNPSPTATGREILDMINMLRPLGIDHHVDICPIILCGDKSSGKTSILGALSNTQISSGNNSCTRFVTEFIFRRHPTKRFKIEIIPGPEKSDDEKKRLETFAFSKTLSDMVQVFEEARSAMKLDGTQNASTNTLRIELSGPSLPHVMIVDLPGLVKAGSEDQSEENSKLVESLTLSYMKKPGSIILAVVSAESDFVHQQIFRHTLALKPHGTRTLGIITKLDKLMEGSDRERFYSRLAQNYAVWFQLGWHLLYNTYRTRNPEGDTQEVQFFSKPIWSQFQPAQLGLKALNSRVDTITRDQYLAQVPTLLHDIDTRIAQYKAELANPGVSRMTTPEQRTYLIDAATEISNLLKASVNGVYTDPFFQDTQDSVNGVYTNPFFQDAQDSVNGVHTNPFFQDTQDSVGCKRRLRAEVQNTLADFAKRMRAYGHARTIVENSNLIQEVGYISRSSFITEIQNLAEEYRREDSAGTCNPLVLAELFRNQSKPWKALAHDLADRIFAYSLDHVQSIVDHVLDEKPAQFLNQNVVNPSMAALKAVLSIEIDEILKPYLSGHPITYNHGLIELVQQARDNRHRNELETILKQFFHTNDIGRDLNARFKIGSLVNALMSTTTLDLEKFPCALALDMMEAYYEIALEQVIAEISTVAIETLLMQKLPSIISPTDVRRLWDFEVRSTVAVAEDEDAEVSAKRLELTEKICVLQCSQEQLQWLAKYDNPLALRAKNRPEPPGDVVDTGESGTSREASVQPQKRQKVAPWDEFVSYAEDDD
ncbi:dynamin family protein [Phlyctema vagabunda]|uniref:Dynamin family protein n=1 Tax=Phlyctema vagabunda TaxID=108571 RepID=A0ABR4PDY4_9HELO